MPDQKPSIWAWSDPRHGQILALGTLLLFGVFWRGFDVSLGGAATIVAVAVLVQAVGGLTERRWAANPHSWIAAVDPRSALITSFSLCLLLRANDLWLLALAAALAIGSKFLIRINGRHIFNPANFAIVALLLLSDGAWVSPGQWGTGPLLVAAFLMAALLVLSRAGRLDTAIVFLGVYAALLFGRALLLGDPLAIPLHQLQSGALLLFTGFMITDPKTTPESRAGRVLFALAVAVLGYGLQFHAFIPEGHFYALFLACLARPALDALMPGARYEWAAPKALLNIGGRNK